MNNKVVELSWVHTILRENQGLDIPEIPIGVNILSYN